MQQSSLAEQAAPVRAEKPSGQPKHHWHARRPPLPRIRLIGRSPLNRALTALWPWSVADYPGILKAARELFRDRVRPDTIKKWRQGKHRPPIWALDLALAEIDRRVDSLLHARALLQKEKSAD